MGDFRQTISLAGILKPSKNNTGNAGNAKYRRNFQAVLGFPEFPERAIRAYEDMPSAYEGLKRPS